MKWKPSAFDDEITAVERALTADRRLLERSLVDYVDDVRGNAVNTITSPKFLLGALAAGFVAGKFLLRERPAKAEQQPVRKSVLGLLGAGALSLAQAQFGGPVGLARWLTGQAMAMRRSVRHVQTGEAVPRPAPTPYRTSPARPTAPAGGETASLLQQRR